MKNVKRQFKIKNFYFAFFVIVFSFSLFVFRSAPAAAAGLFFETEQQQFLTGQKFTVRLMLDPAGQTVNAVEGAVIFPADRLAPAGINEGASVIGLWVRKPALAEPGRIEFAGIMPAGFSGLLGADWPGERPGPVLELIFTARQSGEIKLWLDQPRVLLHDGKGTPLAVASPPLTLRLTGVFKEMPVEEADADREPPEDFKPVVGRAPHIFDGQWFVSFAARDPESGVAYFEIAEVKHRASGFAKLPWRRAESPYLLNDQKLASFIYVKAVDQAGNERVAAVPPRYPAVWYERGILWSIIILTLIGFSGYWLWLKKRKT